MSDDLNELKNSPQRSSQQIKKEKEKPVAETAGAGNVAEQVNPKRSIVESVINSMANGEIGKDGQKKGIGIAKTTDQEKSKNKDIGELRNLVSRISETIPEKRSLSAVAGREEISDQEKLPEPNIESASREIEEKIDREIDKEMEARINKEMEKKIKNETEVVATASLEVNKKEKKDKKNEDAEKLKSLINRISKTAGKEDVEESVMEKTGKILEKKEDRASSLLSPRRSLSAEDCDEKTRNPLQSSAERLQRGESSGKKNNIAGIPLTGEIQKRLPSELSSVDTKDIASRNKVENKEKKSFWSNISEKLKKGDNREKISEIKTVPSKKILEDKVEKHNKSGVLAGNNKKIEKTEKDKSFYLKSDEYVFPENRLIHGKQKFYSSVSKRIKLREDKGEMEGLKNASDIKKKQKILSREEEYKRLKKSIISKYHVKLFQLPWKKIIPVSLIIILVAGASFYYAMSVLVPKPVSLLPPDVAYGEELSEFINIEKKITISEGSLRGFDSLETGAKDIFDANRKIKIIKLVIVNTEDKENRNILSLQNSFDAFGVNKNSLPERFLEISANKYDFFIFKTKDEHIRYGIAIGLKDRYLMSEIMKEWEEERSANKKMITVFKPLFASDKNYGDIYRSFNSENYNGVEIKYVHLIDENTALNYFIYNNNEEDGNDLLVVTTSRNDAHTIVDLLAGNRYR